MSTIKTTYLQHPSASSPNFTLDNSGGVAINGPMTGAGLDHIITQSFSGVSSVSVDNCFSSEYENYRIVMNSIGSTSQNTEFRFRINQVDNSSSVYDYSGVYNIGTTPYGFDTQNGSLFSLNITSTMATAWFVYDLFKPYQSVATLLLGSVAQTNGAAGRHGSVSGVHTDATSFDGFKIQTDSGTMTGTIRVYGYKD